MKAKRLKESKRISNGVFYELDTPIKHEGKTYRVICTWAARASRSGILTFPARSGVIAVQRKDGKLLPKGDIVAIDGFVKASELLARIGAEEVTA